MLHINVFSKALVSRSLQIAGQNVHTTATTLLKQIVERKQDKCLVVEGAIVPSPREPYLLRLPEVEDKECCCLCKLDLDIKHTDVLIISQFIRSDGRMLPRRVTKLCSKQQRRMSDLVTMCQKAGLLSKNPRNRRDDKKFNNYWEESYMKPV